MPWFHNPFGPQIALYAQHMMCVCLGDAFHHGVEGIDLLQGHMTANGTVLCGVLMIVEIAVVGGGEDDIVSL